MNGFVRERSGNDDISRKMSERLSWLQDDGHASHCRAQAECAAELCALATPLASSDMQIWRYESSSIG